MSPMILFIAGVAVGALALFLWQVWYWDRNER